MNMQQLLTKIKGITNLRAGASKKEIAAAEKAMKLKFPSSFREYLLTSNGQVDNDSLPWRLASVDEIVEQWKDERIQDKDYPNELTGYINDDKMQNTMRSPKWIPFLGAPNWDQDIVYIDLVPGPKGQIGQVIALVSECDFDVLAPSFEAFLERWLKNKKPI